LGRETGKGLGLPYCTPESLQAAREAEKYAFRGHATAAVRKTAAAMANIVSTLSIRESSLAAGSDSR
jgi:hypothetical protein